MVELVTELAPLLSLVPSLLAGRLVLRLFPVGRKREYSLL